MLLRRPVRRCKSCGKILKLREGEAPSLFRRRITCDADCYNKWIDERRSKTAHPKCFCGLPSSDVGTLFCCWEHRLIFMKCKQWGIVVSVATYEARVTLLTIQQLEIDKETPGNGVSLSSLEIWY